MVAEVGLCITACSLVPGIWWRKRRPACCLRKRNCELKGQVLFEATPGCGNPHPEHQSAPTVKPPGAAAAMFNSHWSLFKARELLVRKPARSQLRRGQHVFLETGAAACGHVKSSSLRMKLFWPYLCTLTQQLSLMCAACPAQKLLLIDPDYAWILDEADPQPEVL